MITKLFDYSFVLLLESVVVLEVFLSVIILEEGGSVAAVRRMVNVSEVIHEVFELSPDVLFLLITVHIDVSV